MNRNKIRWLILLIFCLLTLIPVSCGKNSAVLSESNQAQIYASVIKQLYVIDYPPGSAVGYIRRYTDDSAGTESSKLNSNLLSESLQKAVLTALGYIHQYFKWVDKGSEVSDDVFSGSGCQIILGNIYLQEDDSVQVTASLFFGGLGGGGTTYILKIINGVWTVTGRTGSSWMS
jgi:hypothetical protein